MGRFLAVIVVGLLSAGCAGFWGERGNYAWCNERYLYSRKPPVANAQHLRFADRGYLYAVAGALVLQEADVEGDDYHFDLPSRMRPIEGPSQSGKYGFDVKAFDVLEASTSNNIEEVIIAFVGSNDWADWLWTNFLLSKQQHSLARTYVKEIAKMRPGKRIVVTGFSLGGALAVHVTKHEDTKDFVSEAWAFNPSPKTWVSGETNRKIWLGAARGEVLSSVRSVFFRWLPGVNNIGAPPDQTAEDFYLIETSGIYGHFRWVLPRNMLHMADYQKAPNNIPLSTEPLEILKRSRFSICKKVLEDSRPES